MTEALDRTPEAALDPGTRDRLLAEPALILGDRELMRALVAAREAELGENVIDIRGRAMQALEHRLDRLESAHESVISAAYENQAGTQTIHRAVLSLLEPMDFPGFLETLETDVAPILRVETLKLVMESPEDAAPSDTGPLVVLPAGSIGRLIAAGRKAPRGDDIVLRRASPETLAVHGTEVRSEALLPLDLGPGRRPALLVMGSRDVGRFSPAQGTDLLRFFAQVFRLVLIGWLRG
ncbi:DUF484 family protein [Paracoccus chinensis]|uniref:DUF484 family protein n=1 Tax=Paracoccus chinensis TaxID=525640 RepID=A0A1G9CN63_9RHOB|nr:DUF484 family protein [Paracoccus chinensis]SDK53131.1 hypothetical protein SAMN04487971_101283 [Paracoccus chinensis]